MPFLNRLQKWAADKPHEAAVVCGNKYSSWSELAATAVSLVETDADLRILQEPNSISFAARWAAGVAGNRECAVLDHTWPADLSTKVRGLLGERWRTAEYRVEELQDGDPGESFLVGLTSGTTSVPKAFSRTRASWQSSFKASVRLFGLKPQDRVLAPGPLSASLNLYTLSECLYAGSSFHTLPQFDAGDAHAEIQHRGITRLVVVPSVLRILAERGLAGNVDASGISTIVCAGQKLDHRTLEACRRWVPQATIWEYYGASELSFVTAKPHHLADNTAITGTNTAVGRAFPGVDVSILDNEGHRLPDGEIGNISVNSDMVSSGYLWGDDGLALTNFGSWCTVRDQGFLREGELHVLGRTQDMINTAGNNVYPYEVEAALGTLPSLAEVVVVGVPDSTRGQRIVAGIIATHAGLSQFQLRTELEGRLAQGKCPHQYVALDELPITDNGKVSRALLRRWVQEGDSRVRPMP